MTLTIYDAAMAGVVVAGMIWGAWRGVTWQVASIASLVLGYMVAHPASAQLAPHFPGDPVIARALAMLAVYAGVSGLVFLGAWAIRTTLRAMKFEAFDRHLGMILGGLEGALLGVVVTFFVVSLAPATRDPIFASPAGRVVGRVMAALGPILPGEARDALAPFLAQAKQAVATGEAVLPVVAPQIQSAWSRPAPAIATPDATPDPGLAESTPTDHDIQRASHSDDDAARAPRRRR